VSRPHSDGRAVAFDPMASLAGATRHRMTPEKFWARVEHSPGCWLWTGRKAPEGYGIISWCWREVGTHRLAFALSHRPLVDGEVVRHTCDNPPCCNPAHLIVGSIADNNADMHARGRAYIPKPTPGTSNVNAKLTEAMVRGLREAWDKGESIKSIASRTGLAVGTVHPMLHGKTWKHVEPARRASPLWAPSAEPYVSALLSASHLSQPAEAR
jgi:hypothetical protein